MKKVILFVCTVFTLSSCAIVSAPVNGAIYQKTQSAVSATANTLGSKKGEATGYQHLRARCLWRRQHTESGERSGYHEDQPCGPAV